MLRRFTPDLVTAISDCVQPVSDQCLAQGLVPEAVYKKVLESGGTSEDKARTLILAIKKSTETDNRCLKILLNILDEQLPHGIKDKLLSAIRRELESELKALKSQTQESGSTRNGTRLTEKHHPVLLKQLTKHSTKWRKIGSSLGFLPSKLEEIQAKPLLLDDAPISWLSEMLSVWLQWAPGDNRGSTSFATLEGLKDALREAGFGATAYDLTVETCLL